jgi:hypothetical protein
MKSMWQFNLNRTVKLQVPPGKRYAKRLAWLTVSISYLMMILESLRKFRDQSIKEAKMTPQINYLEHYLNERYGTGTQIWIGDGYLLGPWCWYGGPPAGQVDFFMVEPYNYCYSDNVVTTIDFVVNIPISLSTQTQQIAAIVQKYKLAGKSFIIQLH